MFKLSDIVFRFLNLKKYGFYLISLRLIDNIMEESNKENKMSQAVYAKLIENEAELTTYLKYIRHRPQPNRIIFSLHKNAVLPQKELLRQKKLTIEVKPYVEEYLKVIREATSMQNYSGRKITSKMIQYLQELPTMEILVETINSFGRQRKKLCLCESVIMAGVNDEMVPLFQKILQKVQLLKKQVQSKKLVQLGQRIAHLHKMVEITPKQPFFSVDSPLRKLQPDRVEKYLVMEESITRAQKRYGKFSENFYKNREVFSNINRVYQEISKNKQINN